MTKKPSLLCIPFVAILLACGGDPAHESGQPDDRAEPKSADEAMAQEADRTERQKALRDKDLCTPEAIRNAPEPDERFWHCRGEDWTGTTQIKDKLTELSSDSAAYREYCSKMLLDGLGIQRILCDGVEH
jgi:hypothetical protein